MNTARLVLFACLGLLAPALQAAGDSCCRSVETNAAPALSARSIYQLDASWINDRGQTFKLADLRGRPVVLAMFFTSCGYACPRIVSDMTHIQETLPAAVRDQARFVLVSFDHERDTIPALRTYRELHDLSADNWVLLRGAPDEIRELAVTLGVKYKKNAFGMFEHSNLITILNAEGEIIHQRAGLEGGLAEAIQAVVASR